ncbi:hypothetical protein PBAL39_15964 [Pedobacter sp. BAL39]|uniref:hypothetical protein n=1 Tax=Pedobacter sp. BAL39 TaxID=391596 RepID=UPI000155A1D7|nr:hypothetical protein [Pedobacter sp. BAL39]EDM37936.1 hypothetical protein PBAL39_15964 [Pedobacter sp. BAL39]
MKINDKYNGIVLAVLVLLIIVIVLVVRSVKTNYYTIIIDAQLREKDDNHFKDCYLKLNGNNYLITDYYRYKNDHLIEYKSATSSGFAVFNLIDSNSSYNGSRDRYKKLWYKQKSDSFALDNEKYKIDYVHKDTVVSNIDRTAIKVVIQKFVD